MLDIRPRETRAFSLGASRFASGSFASAGQSPAVFGVRIHLRLRWPAVINDAVGCLSLESFPNFGANVAQLVEQRFRKARVVSSILTVGSIS